MITILAFTVLHFANQDSSLNNKRVTFEADSLPVRQTFEGLCKAADVPLIWNAGEVFGKIVASFKDDPLPMALERCAEAADPPLAWREIQGKVYVEKDALITLKGTDSIMNAIREVCKQARLEIKEIVSVPQGSIELNFVRKPARQVLAFLHGSARPRRTFSIVGSTIKIGLPNDAPDPGTADTSPREGDVRVESHSGAEAKWVEISRDGKHALISGRGTTQLIDMATGLVTRNLPGTEYSFHPLSNQLYERFNPQENWHDIDKGRTVRSPAKGEGHYSISPDGSTVVHGFNRFEVVDIITGQLIANVSARPDTTSRNFNPDDIGSIFAFSPKCGYLAINHEKSFLVNLNTKLVKEMGKAYATAFSADEKTMAYWLEERVVLVEDLAGTKPAARIPMPHRPTSLFVNQTGSELVVNSEDGLCVYDVASKRLVRKVRSGVTAFAIDERQKIAVAVGGGSFNVYSYPSFQSILETSYRTYEIQKICFANDGHARILAGGFEVNLNPGGEIREVTSDLATLASKHGQTWLSPSGELLAYLDSSASKGQAATLIVHNYRLGLDWSREFTNLPTIIGFGNANELLLCGSKTPNRSHTDYKVSFGEGGNWKPTLSQIPWEPRHHKVAPNGESVISITPEGGEKESVTFVQKIAKNGAAHHSWTLTPDLKEEDRDTKGVQFLGFDGDSKGFYSLVPVRVEDNVHSQLVYCHFGVLEPQFRLQLDSLIRDPESFATSRMGYNFALASWGEVWVGSRRAPRDAKKVKIPSGRVTSLSFSPDGGLLYVGTNEGDVCVWRVKDQQELVRYKVVGNGQVICQSRDRYYMGTPGVGRYALFRFGASTYPFEQFDLRLNRPDRVLETLGLAKPEIIEAYLRAYEMRLDKMKFKEQMLASDFNIPEVKVDKASFPPQTDQRSLSFELTCSDQRAFINNVRVEVNGVPIHKGGGLDFDGQELRLVKSKVDLELAPGRNRIRITALNSQGAGSSPVQYDVFCTAPARKPDLYLVAVGVSRYKQASNNLAYAQKDAEDLAKNLSGQAGTMYGKVNVKLLRSEEALKPAILQTKDFLKEAKVDDVVIVFFAGHGLRGGEKNMEYFFGTHDVDFSAPESAGLAYPELESLVDGIPCRQKLLLLDTCHAGEIDDEESKAFERQPAQLKENGVVLNRGNFSAIANPASVTTLEVMKSLFADFRRGTGAVVVSASAGHQYAIEASGNGIFTDALLEALQGKAPGGSQEVSVSLLANYVAKRVTERTNGAQRPDARSENLDNDFIVVKPKKGK